MGIKTKHSSSEQKKKKKLKSFISSGTLSFKAKYILKISIFLTFASPLNIWRNFFILNLAIFKSLEILSH